MTVLHKGKQVECFSLDYSSPYNPHAEIRVSTLIITKVPTDKIQPINTVVFKKYTEGSDFSFLIVENVVGQVYKWTMPIVGQSWKSGVFGEGVPPVCHGVKIPFSELPKYIREKYLQAKMFQQ